MFDLLRSLSCAGAPAGFESAAADIITGELDRLGVKYSKTPDGAVVAKLKGTGENAPRVMIQAHMDEVGFMVKSHSEEGYLTLAPLGVTDSRLLAGRRIVINGIRLLHGYIGALPVHLSKGKSVPDYSDLYADIGTASKEEAERLAPLGSFGTFDTEFEFFGETNSHIKGKALASRVPCAVLLEVIKRVKDTVAELPYDLYFAFTARGELHISGGAAVYRRICADRVISIVGTEAGDTPDHPHPSCRLGGGIAIPLSEEKYAYNASDVKHLRETAKKCGIKTQNCPPIPASLDCDYDLLRLKNTGARTAAVRIPVRYKGSACEVMNCGDISAAAKLLSSALTDMSI